MGELQFDSTPQQLRPDATRAIRHVTAEVC